MIKPHKIIKDFENIVMDSKHTLAIANINQFDRRVLVEDYAPVALNIELVEKAIKTIKAFFGKEIKYSMVTMLVPKDSTDQVLFVVHDHHGAIRKNTFQSRDFVITIAPTIDPLIPKKQSLLEKDDIEQWK